MSKKYYFKDKKTLVYYPIVYSEPGKMKKTFYAPRTPSALWCYAKQLSQDTVFKAKQYGEDESRFFIFNRGTIVRTYDLILYRSKWYEVTRVDTEEDYNTDVYVYVKDAPTGSLPKEETLKPYGWSPGEDED